MRKILYGLMIFVMLTPGLVCGPFMAAGKAHAAVARKMPGMPDCHDMDVGKNKSKSRSSTMMFKDCAKVDLHGAGHAIVKKPDLKITKVFYSIPDIGVMTGFEPPAFYQIRGPPPETATPQTYPPLYLTTQRLRV